MNNLFSDLKVVEIASALAGPQTGTFFKEMGAQVIKVEPPIGDVSRTWKSPGEKTDVASIYYHSVNGIKDVVNLDLKQTGDRVKLLRYTTEADIVLTNFTAAKAKTYDLTYAKLKEVNHGIILGNITGYGPEVEKPAFDMLLQAASGLLSMTGGKNALAKVPIPIVDILASHQLRAGLLSALYQRQLTGYGSEVQVSLWESALSALANQASNYLMGDILPVPMGTLHPSIAPYGELFQTKDGKQILLAIGSDRQFMSLCHAIEKPHLIEDSRFSTNQARIQHRQELYKTLTSTIEKYDQIEITNLLDKHKVPGIVVPNLSQVLDSKEAADMIIHEKKEQTISTRMRTKAFHMSGPTSN